MTKYVVSGYIGFDNFGDEAIADVLITHLKNNGAKKITVISSNPQKTSFDLKNTTLVIYFLRINQQSFRFVLLYKAVYDRSFSSRSS